MKKRKLIGIFATEVSSRVQGNLYKEIHAKAIENGYNLVMFSGTYDKLNHTTTTDVSNYLFALAQNMDFAAFIIHAQSIGSTETIRNIIDMGKIKNIPIFVYDCDPYGITREDNVITINPNYKEGFRLIVKHLIEHHNCHDIYMLAGNRGNKYSEDRIDIFRQEMKAHQLPFTEDQIGYGDFWEMPAAEALNKYLDSRQDIPQAICCANDSMAITAVKVLNQRGYNVPEDVLVTGFDGIEDGKLNFPAISTCEPELNKVADFIFDLLKGKVSAREFLIPLKFIPKESCNCICDDNIVDKREVVRLIDNIRQNSWQHHMLTTMQFELIDSVYLGDTVGFMKGSLDFFKGYSHLYCIRDDVEYLTDYTGGFSKMRVHYNSGILPDKEYSSFDAKEIFPGYKEVFEQCEEEDIFCFRLINCANKKYGYNLTKGKAYLSNEVNQLGQFVESFVNVVETILRNMRLKQATDKLSEMYEQMSEIYIRDTLTGLYNRHGYYKDLEEYLNREEIKNGYVHVISIDMDSMKQINDNYGHLEGDNAIKAVAKAIKDCFAEPCISARFGGDEFTVALFTDSKDKPSAEKISNKLNNYLSILPSVADKEYKVKVSVGQAVSKISEIEDFKSIEKLADDRMYSDKRKRKAERKN